MKIRCRLIFVFSLFPLKKYYRDVTGGVGGGSNIKCDILFLGGGGEGGLKKCQKCVTSFMDDP